MKRRALQRSVTMSRLDKYSIDERKDDRALAQQSQQRKNQARCYFRFKRDLNSCSLDRSQQSGKTNLHKNDQLGSEIMSIMQTVSSHEDVVAAPEVEDQKRRNNSPKALQLIEATEVTPRNNFSGATSDVEGTWHDSSFYLPCCGMTDEQKSSAILGDDDRILARAPDFDEFSVFSHLSDDDTTCTVTYVNDDDTVRTDVREAILTIKKHANRLGVSDAKLLHSEELLRKVRASQKAEMEENNRLANRKKVTFSKSIDTLESNAMDDKVTERANIPKAVEKSLASWLDSFDRCLYRFSCNKCDSKYGPCMPGGTMGGDLLEIFLADDESVFSGYDFSVTSQSVSDSTYSRRYCDEESLVSDYSVDTSVSSCHSIDVSKSSKIKRGYFAVLSTIGEHADDGRDDCEMASANRSEWRPYWGEHV